MNIRWNYEDMCLKNYVPIFDRLLLDNDEAAGDEDVL